ncbi:FtsX-like permease family protein [Candidatus Dojkabacteria bacterium]|nr:FtsX-like permease family protein [Candidatus Dojkabacteria bacterium]
MTPIGIILISIFALISLVVLTSSIFFPIPRKIGFRNVRRRIGNTILVVIGSLVGSALISGSLILSDSIDLTFLNIVETSIGEQDAEIQFETKEPELSLTPTMSQQEVDEISKVLDKKEIDGVLPVLLVNTTPVKLDKKGEAEINAFNITLFGVDMDKVEKFGQNPQDYFDNISGNEVLISKSLASSLEANKGDLLRITYGQSSFDLKIKNIYEDKGILDSSKIIIDRESLASYLNVPTDSYNRIVISAKGGIRPANIDGKSYTGKDFEKIVKDALEEYKTDRIKLSVTEWKQQALDGYGMKAFVNIFLVLSLFGIFSGILLIVNIYSMLAEERKTEMGILRAIAFSRGDLVRSFVYEGYIYSILASLLGTLTGIGIGYALVSSLGGLFDAISSGTNVGFSLDFKFGFTIQSLLIAFCSGFIITIITVYFSSIKVSKLNIIEAIRNIKHQDKKPGILIWLLKQVPMVMICLAGLLSFMTSLSLPTAMDQMRKQSAENNPLAEMTGEKFGDLKDLIQAYMLYFGLMFLGFAAATLITRLVKRFFNKDINRIVLTVLSIFNIIFTAFMTQIESIESALNQDAGVGLSFISGIILVISLVLIITYNLEVITAILSWVLSPIRSLQSTIQIAFRYPAENKQRTGLTLVMFSLIIYLIVYVGLVKATMNIELSRSIQNTLGGYNLVVYPRRDMTSGQITEIEDKIKENDDVKKVSTVIYSPVQLVDYTNGEVYDETYFENPQYYGPMEKDETFVSAYNSLPVDYIENVDMELEARADEYKDDQAAWDAIIKDSSKVILGDGFSESSYYPNPDIKVGSKLKVADMFGNDVKEVEVIGIVKGDENSMSGVSMAQDIIITTDHLKNMYTEEYLQKFGNKTILVQFNENTNAEELTNSIKKQLIGYNLNAIMNLESMTNLMLQMMNTIMAMFQGFLAFSLVVGTSGLAIIITRTVQERRQQIGMLRSLGFQRWMILISFFIESTFISVLGIIIGISMGTIGALTAFYVAFKDIPDAKPVFPIGEISLICVGVYLAALLFSLLPSLKAARLKPVEATNYPE